jgi:predicted esterase
MALRVRTRRRSSTASGLPDFKEPGGVLLELATDGPGHVDEDRRTSARRCPAAPARIPPRVDRAGAAAADLRRLCTREAVVRGRAVIRPSLLPGAPGALTLLLPHGTGGNEQDSLPLAADLLPGAGVLSPRGKVLEQAWRASSGAQACSDLGDCGSAARELPTSVTAAADHYQFDRTQVMPSLRTARTSRAACWAAGDRRSCTAPYHLRAMVPLVPVPLPSIPRTPVLVSNGRADPIVSVAETERLVALLRAAGADVTLAWQPGGHQLVQADLVRAREWLAAPGPS